MRRVLPMSAFKSFRVMATLAAVVVLSLSFSGCRGNPAAVESIAKYFGAHVDELEGLAPAAAKAEAARVVEEGLAVQAAIDARNAEIAAVRSNPEEDEALQTVCNIYVDFSTPSFDADAQEQSDAQRLANAMSGEAPQNGLKQWSERIVNVYNAVQGEPDEQAQAQAALTRDAVVWGFQKAYCGA